MSFSTDVKRELSRQISPARHCQLAELAALVLFCCEWQDGKLVFSSEHAQVVDVFMVLLKKCLGLRPEIRIRRDQGKKQRVSFCVLIEEDEECERLLQAVESPVLSGGVREEDNLPDRLILRRTCCRRSFLRGAFLAAGSVSDPSRSYHFEIVCQRESLASRLCRILASLGIEGRYVERTHRTVVYVKESDQIGNLLNLMEARVSLLSFENARIVREVRGNVNRKVNCETANIHKTASASVRQIEDIRYIESRMGLSHLPNTLDEMARIRLQYPEANLRELGELLEPPVGKSGVNHRLRKLSLIAEDLRGKEGGVQ